MKFENDLLISYAHIDDQPLLEGQAGWVSTLHRILEIRVAQLLGETPRIWRDPKLQGNDFVQQTILVEQLPKVALLLTVLSPRYIQSEWCTLELEEFCRASAISGGIRIADKARIFKVIKTPIPRERHPESLKPLLGYEFFVVDPQSGRPRELFQASGPDAERAFLAKLDDLAYDIAKLLELLKHGNGNGNGHGNGSAPLPASKGTVYLAETSVDLRDEREAVKRDLLRNGYEVLPDRPLPLVAAELEEFLRDQFARSVLAIHLVGRGYGVVPDGGTHSIVAVQHEIAAAQSGLPRLLWLSPGEVEDERQRRFLEHLRTAPGVHAEAELLEIPLEDLKARIHKKLAPPEPRKEKASSRAEAGGLVRIYLICDQTDLEAARPVEDALFDRGFEVLPTLFDDDEAQARLDHEENLCTCDAVLLFQGQASEMWLRRKLREIQKSAGLGRDRPLLGQALYLGAPQTPQKERFRTLEAQVLREPPDGFSPEVLAPFLAEIVRRREAAS
ncbi:MAG TPA: hypothetical protein VN851_00970 [Thermoanaerobaculia bacterium]|nr:hypothetical protein [Thermoanaerobaculia bacterium]